MRRKVSSSANARRSPFSRRSARPDRASSALALVEFMIVALIGALLGAALGSAIPFAVNWLFGSLLPIPLAPSISPSLMGLGLIYGLLTALAFSIAPLGRAHDLPVTTLIRDLVEERQGWPRKRYLAGAALAGAALVALAVLTSPQRSVAAMVAGATVVSFIALRLVALGIAYLARRAPRSRFVEWRMALDAIHRPGALTPSVVLSLGLGLTALVALTLVEANMRAELREAQPGVTPSFFFLDVRGADAGAVRRLREARGPGRQSQRDADDARALRAARRQAGRKGQAQRQGRLGAGRRSRRHLRRQAAGGFRGRGGDMVAERLFRAAAGVDGEGGGRGPRPPSSATRSSSMCSAATSRRNSRTCAK